MSLSIRTADAIVAELNAHTFTLAATAQRIYLPVFDLEGRTDLVLSVVPREIDIKKLSRNSSVFDISIDLAVQKKFTDGALIEVDPLLTFSEEIAEYLRHQPLSEFPDVTWLSTIHRELYSLDHWEKLNQFTSIMTIVYRMAKTR
jgi:hypothetical protein